MAGIATTAALLLASVLGWAAVGKARRSDAVVRSFHQLRLPAARALGVAVPLSEGAVATVLVVWPRAGGAAALLLLAVFTAVLARAHRLGVGCGCFGTDRRDRVSVVEFARNGLLAVLAGAATMTPVPRVPALEEAVSVTAAAVVGAVALALLAVREDTGRLLDNTLEVGP